ncbi:cytochrome C [Photobacterium kishitanii]|uniref:Cytochrome C n=1 Tax=Photobacterium kishitanii TaxID=318456 RepID=A0AAX0YPP8_9GAMM|nr:cytochrome c [Photobacterium kishitanii]KJG55837.1 cytochrome C [Photobacterium kishitanii]KJG58856.1 cytochrome C [Photobacterium kishitanii]KJG63991.1 cytochrome C [Photobacterium kishitanii]KJG68144.1 cytochrome C [Photobacterium kishitanii]PSU20114.1 cytochrome C [Photobacterium kishitanii]
MKIAVLSLMTFFPLFAGAQALDSEIKQRQQVFSNIEILSEQAEELIDDKNTNWAKLEQVSREIKQQSFLLLDLFPQGSQQGSKAKQAVWNKPQKFSAQLKQMIIGFEQLNQASQERNMHLAGQGMESAQSTCRSCHRSYRSRW